MTNPEYFLVRLTAQSKGADPKEPSGGKPELTAQDIQMLCSMVSRLTDYWAVTAKHCQSDVAEANLLEATRLLSRRLWHDNPTHKSIKVCTDDLDRMAESAVLIFLNPRDPKGNLRSDTWAAQYLGVHRNTFLRKFKTHWSRLVTGLHEMESTGLQDIRRAMRREAS